MDLKPKKPEKQLHKKLKPLESAVALSKDTPADTKALESATKEVTTAVKALETAMGKSHTAYDKLFNLVPELQVPKPGPIPIPYPTFPKLEKEAKGAVKVTLKAQKTLDAAHRKLDRVLDQQIKVLKPAAKKSAGNEAATMKGLVSAKSLGKSQFQAWSMNVKAEGENVTRFIDLAKSKLP